MFLAAISTSSNLVQGSAIPLSDTPTLSTNKNVVLNSANNGVLILTTGIFKVRLQLNATTLAAGTSIGAQLYADGVAVPNTAVNLTLPNSSNGEVVIEYPVKVINSDIGTQALVQFYATQNATPLTGYITVEKVS